MSYQGEQVNFSQTLSTQQISSIITQDVIPRLNKIQMQYPQDPFSASAKSDTDIWNHINRYVWGKSGSESSPKGDWAANPNAPIPQIWKNKDNISTNLQRASVIHKDLQRQLNEAKDERDSIQEKIEGKAMRNHTHARNNGGDDNGKDCGWFGEKCWDNPFDNLFPTLSLTTIAVGGLAAYMILRKKK
jgi:hypothetical protein